MRRRTLLALLLVSGAGFSGWLAVHAQPGPVAKQPTAAPASNAKIDFSRQILPILSDNCFPCHGPDAKNRKAKLRLDEEASAKKSILVPGKRAESELFRRITTTDANEQMPPKKSNRHLTPAQMELLGRWIDEGAPWSTHWSFTKIARPPVPSVTKFADKVRSPIDAFVLARLEKEGLAPSPPASKETLIRRVTLDLTGLPPTPGEVDAFVNDPSPAAYNKVVERLLQTPPFGERQAWDWLDAARFADSNGYQGDGDRTMWPWRDWVVQAFNRNMPFDQFTIWQLAGDLLPNATAEQKLATAFCRNHMINGEGGRIPEENRIDYVMDMTETLGTVWLGLTFNCCRCHDHKFDPLSQAEYYRLFAFFNQTPVNGGGGNPQTAPVLDIATDAQKAEAAKFGPMIAKLGGAVDGLEEKLFPRPKGKPADEAPSVGALPADLKAALKNAASKRNAKQLTALEKEFAVHEPEYVKLVATLRTAIDQRDALNRSLPRVMVMEDMPTQRKTFILTKGLYNKPGQEVTAGLPARLSPLPQGAPLNRLGLAQWLVAPDHPLTARVVVNRFWQQFFGIGLVKTPEDFGIQGEKPPHRALLDWLAAEFIHSGWDVKKLCHTIVTSATYRQSSKVTPALVERDPDNRLLAHGPRLRLPSWMLRDQALAASGLLVPKLGGPPVRPYQPTGIWEEATFGNKRYQQDKGEALYRRSLYIFWRRIVGPTMFFDTAPRQTCSVKQTRTNTPLHALITLNDVTYVEAARALAQRVLVTAEPGTRQRLDLAFRLVLARQPSNEEADLLARSLERTRAQFMVDPDAAKKFLSIGESKRNDALDLVEHASYAALCNMILNLDEALTKE